MITITNRKDKIIIDEKDLRNVKGNYYAVRDDWLIEFEFVIENENITMIRKRLGSSDDCSGDILSEYVNKVNSPNKIVLKKKDFDEVLRLFRRFKEEDNCRKKVIIDSYSRLIAYECYLTYSVCELDEVTIEDIYKEICGCYCCVYRYEKFKYKNAILEKAKEVLKKEYKVDLDYVFDGGNKSE